MESKVYYKSCHEFAAPDAIRRVLIDQVAGIVPARLNRISLVELHLAPSQTASLLPPYMWAVRSPAWIPM